MSDSPRAIRRDSWPWTAGRKRFLVGAGLVYALLSCTPDRPSSPSDDRYRMGIKISPETTYVTEPLLANGTPNYATVLNGTIGLGVTIQNNAVQRLAPVLGMPLPEKTRKLLDIDPRPPPPEHRLSGGFSRDSFEEYFRLHHESATEELEATYEAFVQERQVLDDGYCSSKECPVISEWLRANEPPLTAIAEAAKRPRYWVPLEEGVNLYKSALPSLQGFRNACDAFRARTGLRLGDGDWAAAADDILTNQRLAVLQGQSGLVSAQLVAAACMSGANEALRAAATDPALEVSTARRLASALGELPDIGNFEIVVQQQRFTNLAGIFLLREVVENKGARAWKTILEDDPHAEPRPEGLYRLSVSSIDWNEAMILVNRGWDLALDIARSPTEAAREEARERFRKELAWRAETTETLDGPYLAELLASVDSDREARPRITRAFVDAAGFLPGDFSPFVRKINEPLAERQLGILALALSVYRAEKGKLPHSTDALVPDYLERLPLATQFGHVLRVSRGESSELALTLVPEVVGVSGTRSLCLDTEGRNFVLPDGRKPEVVEGRCQDQPPPSGAPEEAQEPPGLPGASSPASVP